MKVKCKRIISPTTKEDLGAVSPWLTREKEYVVLALEMRATTGINILIQSDHYHEPIFVALDGFEILEQRIPSNWVATSGNNSSYCMMPKSWMYDDFFEELEDQAESAMKLFKEESEIIYREESLID